jgi:hypothetical protein
MFKARNECSRWAREQPFNNRISNLKCENAEFNRSKQLYGVKCLKRGTNVRAGRANNILTTQSTILNNAWGNEIVESLRCTRVWEHAWGRNHPLGTFFPNVEVWM